MYSSFRQHIQLHDQCPKFWSWVDWETHLQGKMILMVVIDHVNLQNKIHNEHYISDFQQFLGPIMGKEHNAIFFQAATLITVFPYTLPIYLKSTMPTYYFTVYPQTLFKRQIFISLVSFSTSPIPQLPKRSVVQHTCK